MTQENQQINLMKFYQTAPSKIKFVRTVAARCRISANAVLKWCQGDGSTKDPERIKVLSEETGIPPENLFNRDLC